MRTSQALALRHLFLIATVASLTLVLVVLVRRENPQPAQLVTGGPRTFTENFDTTDLRDINYSTADWDTANGQLSIPNNRSEARALSLSIDEASDTIESATLNATVVESAGTLEYFLSNDHGITYEPVQPGAEHLFTTKGSELRWKVELARNDSHVAPVIDSLSITYTIRVPDHVIQVNASDPVGLGIEVSKLIFPTPGSAGAVVIGRRDDVIDTFAATPLARKLRAPILFTESTSLNGESLVELQRVLPNRDALVVIVGGTSAVSETVSQELAARGYWHQKRLGGETRYETGAQIARELLRHNATPTTRAYVTEARDLADAFSASAPAGLLTDDTADPVLLLERGKTNVHPATAALLAEHTELTSLTIVGGPASIPEGALTSLSALRPGIAVVRDAGFDRFETNSVVIAEHFSLPSTIVVCDGYSEHTALLAGLTAAYEGGPLILTKPGDLAAATEVYLYDNAPTIARATIIGDISGSNPSVVEQLYNLISRL